MKNILVYILVIAVLVLGVGYFVMKRGSYIASSNSTSPTNNSQPAQMVAISGTEFAFSPSTFTVKAGQPVSLTFTNNGNFPHNLSISDLNVQTKTIQPGEQDTITFTPTRTGSFAFKCSVPTHADKGMTGTLTVQ
jgi:plastocyanin